ncbi:MAG: nucleotidyltransferase family protein [Burkholderiales bacterium]|nr:nucleotidyltransferase family protein [Burkholderiales bacterium]
MKTPSLVAWLLARAAVGARGHGAAPAWPDDDAAFDRHVKWVVDAGLGPLFRHVAEADGAELPARWMVPLLSADLTARVRHGNFVAAASDVVDVCGARGVVPTLLKGISVAGQWYPRSHLRPMGDVDVLVPADAYAGVEAGLARRGFVASGPAALHHGAPLWHPAGGVRVELHTDLFGADSILARAPAFRRESVASNAAASTFEGRDVRRLSPELQFVYVASTLVADLVRHGLDPTFLPTMADAVLLLRATSGTLDWGRVATLAEDGIVRTSTGLLVAYLVRRGLAVVPDEAVATLVRGQPLAGPVNRRAFAFLMDRYLLGARRWDLPLPPPVPGRYSLRRQFENRILRRRRGILENG